MSKEELGSNGHKEMIINTEVIEPGKTTDVRLNIGRLPSATRISINLKVFRANKPGPTMMVLGGLHGDEINGVEIVRRGINGGLFGSIKAGNIIAVPLLNVHGFINFSRDVPDGKDVNRSFPGNMKGSLASRVARTLTKKVLPLVDFGVDFHTGGGDRYNYPQVRYTRGDEISRELAEVFSPPFIIEKGVIKGSLRKTARDMSIPMIVYEGGESLRFDGLSIDHGLDGLRRVLVSCNMLDDDLVPEQNTQLIKRTTWVRAQVSGMFIWFKSSGQQVRKGEPLGELGDPFGGRTYVVRASQDGYLIGHNNASVVHQGDALFHIGLKP